MKTQKKKISQWFIMCDKCHKIIGKKYAKSISNHMRKEVLEDVLRILGTECKECLDLRGNSKKLTSVIKKDDNE
jgi:hypothetical protein